MSSNLTQAHKYAVLVQEIRAVRQALAKVQGTKPIGGYGNGVRASTATALRLEAQALQERLSRLEAERLRLREEVLDAGTR